MNENLLIPENFLLTCPGCKREKRLIAAQQSLYCACGCGTYFNTLGLKREVKINNRDKRFRPFLQTGTKVQIRDTEWTITGIARFAEVDNRTGDHWDCYFLFAPAVGWRYLYDSYGHFLFSKDIEIFKSFSGNRYPTTIIFEDKEYSKYTSYEFETIAAKGEFPVDISRPSDSFEFISPPYSINYYFNPGGLFIEQLEYLDRNEIQVNSTSEVSWPAEPGYRHPIQPNPFIGRLKSTIWLTVFFNVLWFLATIIINQSALNEKIYSYTINENVAGDSASYADTLSSSGKVVVSPSFKLEDNYSNLNIIIETNVSQSWMGMDLNLVNEGTGEVYIVAKDIEYYSGYEGGESWAEGSQSAEALLGGIPPGVYHLEHQPVYSSVSASRPFWSIGIYKDVPIYSNWVFVSLISLLFPSYYYFRSNSIEKNRWNDSPFNPYPTDE